MNDGDIFLKLFRISPSLSRKTSHKTPTAEVHAPIQTCDRGQLMGVDVLFLFITHDLEGCRKRNKAQKSEDEGRPSRNTCSLRYLLLLCSASLGLAGLGGLGVFHCSALRGVTSRREQTSRCSTRMFGVVISVG